MLIYNVTIKVDKTIAQQWLQWMKKVHIPEVMQTRCFTSYQMIRLLEVDDSEGPTYAVQYYAKTMEDYTKYINDYAPALRQTTSDKWGERYIAFRTLMEVVH